MNKSNAYFQLIINDHGTSLKIIPVNNGDEYLSIEEVIKYIEKNGIHNYNLKELNNAIRQVQEISEVPLISEKIDPVNEMMEFKISDNKLYVIARFYAPSNLGHRISKEEIIMQLNFSKIKFGIDEQAINNHLLSSTFCEDIVIARGLAPVNGNDAFITYHFLTDLKVKPKLNEDGTVDFHQLNNISHIKAGDILATLTPEDPGKSGKDVYENEIKPKKVARNILRYGKNITIAEDNLSITSDVDGHVMLVGDKVFVYNTYDVPADVDNSTGDIEYEGNIFIKGNVRSGFKVKASGNVEIDGVVEAAQVVAGGNIILKRGIQGMGKGLLVCGGNLVAKFIESSTAYVDGYVHTETILHSKVSADGDVIIQGKKASLIGGHIRSATLIESKIIGSAMGTATIVEVGMDPKLKDKINKSTKTLDEKSVELSKFRQICEMLAKKNEMGQLDSEKKQLLIKMINNIKLLKSEIVDLNEEIIKLNSNLAVFEHARIQIHGDIYPGVKVIISDDFVLIHNTAYNCQFKKQNGEIVSVPL